jgi:ectoine hydroxylase-related dioxygenase (phytanoyl-CoA dioxygenase family)
MEFAELSADQRRIFDEEGYLIVRNALREEEVSRLIEACDRLLASGSLKGRQTVGERIDGYRNCVSRDEAFRKLLTHGTTVPLVVQLLGHHIKLLTSHFIHKEPDPPDTPATYRSPDWHRDIAGMPEDLSNTNVPRVEIKIAYYLTDLSEPQSGVTLVAPGSNILNGPLEIPAGQPDPVGAVEPSLKPGDALLFENRTFHAGGVNLSGRARKAVMFGYGYQWMGNDDYVTQPDGLLESVDDIGKQLLKGLKDPQGRYISGGISEPLAKWVNEHDVALPREPHVRRLHVSSQT